MKLKAQIKGVDEMIARLDRLADPDAVRRVVNANTVQMVELMKRNAKFRQGYSTGATKASIRSQRRDKGYTGIAMPMTEYSVYLEYGTRHMAPQPFVMPTYTKQKRIFIKDIAATLK